MLCLAGTLLVCAGTIGAAQSAAPANTCVQCHQDLPESRLSDPVKEIQSDIHGSRGLSCVNCHGGDAAKSDADLSMNPAAGFIGKPQAAALASFCGKCHSNAEYMRSFNPSLRVDQEAEYRTSVHGKLVAQGDAKPATCIKCHGTHGIRSVKSISSPVHPTRVADTCGGCHANAEFMKPYGIATDQLEKYKTSIHAQALLKNLDLSAPTCNDCHGNHGATPPGIESVANVCGTCHVRQSDLFQKSPHKPVFEGLGIGDCLACHGNHDTAHPTDAMLGNDDKAVCTTCHGEGAGFDAAGRMRRAIGLLDERIQSADVLLGRGTRLGMEVSRIKFELNEARNNLIDARVVVHAFDPDQLDAAVKPGMDIAGKAYEQGLQALDEAAFRRKGLALSLIVIGLAILAIYLKIRDIERVS